MDERLYTQVLIIGAGVAGCTAAITLADAGLEVTIVNTDKDIGGGNSELAQGGVIYKGSHGKDTSLAEDILVAGHAYNYKTSVEYLCTQGPKVIENMLMGRTPVAFDKNNDGSWHLTQEGGHSVPRIVHTADYTGSAIMDAVGAAVRAHPRIRTLQGHCAIDLLTSRHHGHGSDYRYCVKNRCAGAYVYHTEIQKIRTILADWTILATGGVGQVFLHSTNAHTCVGSGISMAHRAGVALANLEFMQFHPTALYNKMSHRRSLITEAMRGEGARLLNAEGQAFMTRYDPRGDMAPRDIVSQAMVAEMLRTGTPCLYLDASPVEQDIAVRFPTVLQNCLDIGVDIRQKPVPVVPAAHYFCGGILTDLNGRTDLHGLYAVGECACTGVHGANRLASTSLLEAIAWGHSAGEDIVERSAKEASLPTTLRSVIPDWHHMGEENNDDPALIAQDWATIRHTMWNYVGITRTTVRLRRAFEDLRELSRHIHDFYKRTPLSPPLVDLFHGVHTAYVITQAALRNKKSIGCHYRVD